MTQDTIYHRPDTLDEALVHLAEGAPRVAAGCTDLFPATERKVLPGPIVDISKVAGLRGVQVGPDGVTIGATTTWADLIAANLPPAFDGLKLAAREVGARQIQARGTVAGNLCNASPAADGVPPLLTLDAQVTLQSTRGARKLGLSEFLTGPRQTARAADELLTDIHIPAEATEGMGFFLKLGPRSYLVISIAMTAARVRVEDGIVQSAALAIGACSPVATRLTEAEAALIGAPLDPMRITEDMVVPHLAPIDDMRADAGYRRGTALDLLRRTLAPLRQRQAA
ncbi:MAG: FAD binding domain-containing protein [Pseudomonadota bacterium]